MSGAGVVEMPKRRKQVGDYIGTPELAERWGVSEDTIRRIPPEELPRFRPSPNTIRFRVADVIEYEKRRTDSGGQDAVQA